VGLHSGRSQYPVSKGRQAVEPLKFPPKRVTHVNEAAEQKRRENKEWSPPPPGHYGTPGSSIATTRGMRYPFCATSPRNDLIAASGAEYQLGPGTYFTQGQPSSLLSDSHAVMSPFRSADPRFSKTPQYTTEYRLGPSTTLMRQSFNVTFSG